VVKVLC